MNKLAILGASGHGKVIADSALLSGAWDEVVFFDDGYPAIQAVECWAVVGNTEDLAGTYQLYDGVVVAIGNNSVRINKQAYLSKQGCQIVSIIHPNAVISPRALIAQGTVVMAGAVINPFSVVGAGCIINTNAVIEHDCILADGAQIGPGTLLAGAVKVGSNSLIGIGCSVKQLICIGADITVGAGAVVVKDIAEPGTYVGIPARKLIKS